MAGFCIICNLLVYYKKPIKLIAVVIRGGQSGLPDPDGS